VAIVWNDGKHNLAFRRLFLGREGQSDTGDDDANAEATGNLWVKVAINLKVVSVRRFSHPDELGTPPLNPSDGSSGATVGNGGGDGYRSPPPILVVQDAISADLAAELRAYLDGELEGAHHDDRGAKSRSHIVLRGTSTRDDRALERKLDDKLARSVFPEIRKCFFYNVTHRENWKLARYVLPRAPTCSRSGRTLCL
jgi:hypothetical protein